MSQVTASDYHFCTLSELQNPKQLPSLDFVNKILNICHVPMTLFESPQRNIYDRKNHILHINNYDSYARALREKYGRSVESFEKQLKMMGFKKRKIKQHSLQSYTDIKIEPALETSRLDLKQEIRDDGKIGDLKRVPLDDNERNNRMFNDQNCEIKKQKTNPIKYMLVWRTNRHTLVENELQSLEQIFSKEVEKGIALKQEMEKRKKNLDSKLETIIFNSLLNSNQNLFADMDTEISTSGLKKPKTNTKSETILEKSLIDALKEMKLLSNESQIQSRSMVRTISENSAKELELFRILIYKESHIHKATQEQ